MPHRAAAPRPRSPLVPIGELAVATYAEVLKSGRAARVAGRAGAGLHRFLFALLFLIDRPNRWTVSLGLSLLADGVEVPKTVLMAGSVILTLPIVVLFLAGERLLTEGLTSGAEKG
ncbi:hypothetical protein [Micromonospora sp. NPDC005806]|uniref:hypothetical protein n=1 Tax=Micromonospora sp. NPDC005806 TaxID=3364234 RepID=UPI00369F48C7